MIFYQALAKYMIFKNIYTNYRELKKEHDYYARENFLKEERIRKLKSQVKELEKEIEELKNKKRGRKKND